ncbi:MAG: DUF6128 domain-containing protein, partial [Eubacteriales bacterium]|nr:DUF6128 domain-containing protein [Eubacteriales bacterium]
PEKEKPEKRPEKVSEIEKPADTQPGEEEKPETETAQEMRAQMEVESKLEKEYEKENNEMWETEKMNGNSPRLSEPDLEAQSVNDQEMQPASAREEQLVNAREMQPANGWDVRLQPDNTREMQKAPPEVNPAGNPSVPLKKVNSNRYTSYNRNTSHDRNTSQERSTPYKSAPYKRNPSRSPASVTFTFGEPYSPFSDGEIINCRKIHPKDLAHFSRRDCSLRNNRFLLYGYYNFGHLLVGTTASGQCILGVPGGYDQQERFMANMFGFPYFKECRQIELPKGRGGYWYRSINAPNTH